MSFLRCRSFVARTLFVALVGPASSFANAQSSLYAAAPTPIEIKATPITSFSNRDPSLIRFGDLQFRGGLELTSKNPAFGGISGLHIEPDGEHFLAVTDHGSWLRGRIVYRDGKPIGIADAEMAPILGLDGKPLAGRGWYDAESLTERDGVFYIGIERVEQIVRFDYRRDGLLARGEPIKTPNDFRTFKYNKSLECLTSPPSGTTLAGALIAVTERSLDSAGNLRSFLLDGDRVTRFSVKRTDDFDVTDCAILPPSDLLLLERRYSLLRGVAMRWRWRSAPSRSSAINSIFVPPKSTPMRRELLFVRAIVQVPFGRAAFYLAREAIGKAGFAYRSPGFSRIKRTRGIGSRCGAETFLVSSELFGHSDRSTLWD